MNCRREVLIAGLLTLPLFSAAQQALRKPQSAHVRPPSLGDDIVNVIGALAQVVKGEFETTEQFEARRAAKFSPLSHLRFVVEDAEFTYNADLAEMTAVLTADRTFIPEAPSTIDRGVDGVMLYGRSLTLLVKRIRHTGRTYIANNVFGASFPVERIDYDDYGVRLDPASRIKFGNPDNPYGNLLRSVFTFSIDAKSAQNSKPFLRLAVDGILSDRRTWLSRDSHQPTILEPYDTTDRGHFIALRLDRVVILDARSAEVVSDFDASMKVIN